MNDCLILIKNMRGGFRKNAGRKKGFAAKNAEEARKLLSERLAEEINPISEVLILEAKKGNIKAIKELFDRAWGRSAQEINHGDNRPLSEITGMKIVFDKSFDK